MIVPIDTLRSRVSRIISNARYEHTLGVEDMAVKLGKIFIPDKINELRAAALLHDIAKELTVPEQLKLISEHSIPVSPEDLDTLPALHSFAACGVIERDFSEYSTAEILSAVYNHTLGDPNMSIFDKIIYIADYIEEGRRYHESIAVRSYLQKALLDACVVDKLPCLDRAIVMSIDNTVKRLTALGKPINSKTLLTKSALLPLI